MSEHTPCRMRITFRKKDPLKYISHLDLLRAWERILRRAGLPMAYSRGFSPHPRITIAMPLPVGCTGQAEVIDVILDEPLSADEVIASLEPTLPRGISIVAVEQVPHKSPALPSMIRQATYLVTLVGVSEKEVEQRVADLMHRDTLQVEFRRKTFDLRPLIGSLALKRTLPRAEHWAHTPGETDVSRAPHDPRGAYDPCRYDTTTLEAALLRDRKGRIGRPDVLLKALGLSEYARRIDRVSITFESRQV